MKKSTVCRFVRNASSEQKWLCFGGNVSVEMLRFQSVPNQMVSKLISQPSKECYFPARQSVVSFPEHPIRSLLHFAPSGSPRYVVGRCPVVHPSIWAAQTRSSCPSTWKRELLEKFNFSPAQTLNIWRIYFSCWTWVFTQFKKKSV